VDKANGVAEAVFGSASGSNCNGQQLYDFYQINLSPSGTLYVADTYHDRILGLKNAVTSSFDTADFVIGQANLTTCAEETFYDIYGVLVDNNDNLWIGDGTGEASLRGFHSASTLQGIPPNPFTTNTAACGVFLYYDNATDSLYAPCDNYVYRFDDVSSGITSAPVLFGDGADGASRTSFVSGQAVVLDSAGNLYVSDEDGNRVLVWLNAREITANNTPADFVLGQNGNFTSTARTEMWSPGQMVWDDAKQQLLIANYHNGDSGQVIAYSVTLPSASPSPSSAPASSSNEAGRIHSWFALFMLSSFI